MWHGYAVTSSTLLADPPSNETIDVFYIKTGLFTYKLFIIETQKIVVTATKIIFMVVFTISL